MERDRPSDQAPGPEGLTSGDPLGAAPPSPAGDGPESTDPAAVAASAGLGEVEGAPPGTGAGATGATGAGGTGAGGTEASGWAGPPGAAGGSGAGPRASSVPAPQSPSSAPGGRAPFSDPPSGASSALGGAPVREPAAAGWPGLGTAEPGGPLGAPAGYGAGPVPPGAWGAPVPGARPVYELASWGRRVGAFVIDSLIVGVVALAVLLVMVAAFGGVGFIGGDETGYAGLVLGALVGGLVAFVISLLYAPLWMSRTNGRTLGRQLMGIRVVRANGRATDFWWSALRESVLKTLVFGGVGSGVTFGLAWLADVLWPLWDDQNRALHDFIVDSRVVRD